MMYHYRCCRFCNNNPANNPNASGFCCCVLPYMETPILTDMDNSFTYKEPYLEYPNNNMVYYTTDTTVIK